MINTIIFDNDGTLYEDHKRCDFKTWKKLFFDEFGIKLSYDIYHNAAGGSGEDFLVKNARVGQSEARKLFLRQGELFSKQIRVDGLKKPYGLDNLLEDLKTNNFKLGIASSGNYPKVMGVLTYFKIESYFDTIVTITDVERGKPHPDLFIETMQRLNTTPNNAAIIEDSPNGIRSAKASNSKLVIGITITHSKEQLKKVNPDLIIDSFTRLNSTYFKQF